MCKKIIYCLLLISLTFVQCRTKQDKPLRIATSANMQFVIKELIAAFSSSHHIVCEAIINSSGKLTAQIIEGAPYDVFVSADMKYPQLLHDKGVADSPPKVYAFGKLILWSLSKEVDLELLQKPAIKHIALANPQLAPYGMAAVDALKHFKLYERLSDKYVFGESIAQVNQFVYSKVADIGFTALSVVMASHLKDKGSWMILPKESYQPIEQGIVFLKNNRNRQMEAAAFYRFLFTEEAKYILENYGYSTAE